MTKAHVVAVSAFEGMAPFEPGVVVEVFGLARPELGDLPRYELRVCAEQPHRDLRAVGGFSLRAEYGPDTLAAADTVIVPGVAGAGATVSPALGTRCAGPTRAGRDRCRSARARSRRPRPACSTDGAPPRTGAGRSRRPPGSARAGRYRGAGRGISGRGWTGGRW
ncbi:hypothetical protein [Embleya sp. NPDC001921]